MKSLKIPEEPFEIEILPSIKFTVKPLSTFDMSVAQAAARSAIEKMESSLSDVYYAGLLPKCEIDLSDPAVRDGLYHELLIGELAERHIIAWEGVTDEEGEVIDVSVRYARRMAVRIFPIGQIFYAKLTEKHMEILAAKKG